MNAFRACMLFTATVVAVGSVASAGDKRTSDHGATSAGFEKIKALSGVWQVGHSPTEHGMSGGTVSYKLTAGGNAVLETLFGGTDHEMVTLYYPDGNALALTHYCMLGNRPRMRALPGSGPNKIVFKCQPEENAAIESQDHMHQVTFTFIDADHLKTEWVLYKGGKAASTHAFDLVRKKK